MGHLLANSDAFSILNTIVQLSKNGVLWHFTGDSGLIAAKSLFLLLPISFLILVAWVALISLPLIVLRANRQHYLAVFLINVWDGGRSIVNYWAGIFRLSFILFSWAISGLKVLFIGTLEFLKDIIVSPVTIISKLGRSFTNPGVPWPAVFFTIFWIVLEASLFTFILTPLVNEIFLGMTNVELPRIVLSSGLFIFLFMIIGGSLACMQALFDAIEKKRPVDIFKMSVIELIVMMVEVVFFYREFVEAVMPFFNRMTDEGLHLGPGIVLGIGIMAWIGVRSSIWFFFGRFGTPTLLQVIARKDIEESAQIGKTHQQNNEIFGNVKKFSQNVKNEMSWFRERGVEIISLIVLPPLQIFAVMTNILMHLLIGKNLFNLPILKLEDVGNTNDLIEEVNAHIKEA